MQRKCAANDGTWSRKAVWSMPLPAIRRRGSPSPVVSTYVFNPLAVTSGIAAPCVGRPSRSRRENAIAGPEHDSELGPHGAKRLVAVLLHAHPGATRAQPDRIVDLGAEICRAHQRAVQRVEPVGRRFAV